MGKSPQSSKKHWLQSFAFPAQIIYDLLIIAIAWWAAYLFRFNLFGIPEFDINKILLEIAILLPIQALINWLCGLFQVVWRYTSFVDIIQAIKAVVIGTAVSGLIFLLLFTKGYFFIPRSVLPLYAIFFLCLYSAPRLLYRWIHEQRWLNPGSNKRALVIGAGSAGESLIRDMRRTHLYRPVGIVDDNPRRKGLLLHGIKVLGRLSDIPKLLKTQQIDLLIFAIPSASRELIQHTYQLAEQHHVPLRITPGLHDLVGGRVHLNELREIQIEDLLGREPVQEDQHDLTQVIDGHSVLVTGGGGSIGSELCRQIASLKPKELIILEHSEYALYRIERELQKAFPSLAITSQLGSVADEQFVDRVMSRHHPDLIFHAAAYKHVPMLEHQVNTAVKNNVLGSIIMANAAAKYKTDKFVLVSTDKAVNPANIMGMTKRIAEIYCQNLSQHSDTHFITTRFGNVLGSDGSVVPLFKKQIAAGGPVTVTDPNITRYFMTIPEAVHLILQAAAMGKGGEIFVLDMGQPIKIADLATQMIKLAGKLPGKDIKIEYTGLRPGEKLYEELFHDKEPLETTTHPKINLSQARSLPWEEVKQYTQEIEQAFTENHLEQLCKLLNQLVPENTRKS